MRWLRLAAAWLPIVVLVALVPVYVCYLVQPAAGYFHDDGVYLVNALSLVSGHGYRTISLPNEIFQTKYPFLYPALLAILWKLFPVFPTNLFVFKFASMCATGVWALATYRLTLRETNDPVIARWVAVLLLTFPWVVFLSATTMPETIFAAASMGSLLLFDDGDRRQRKLIGGAALASAAVLLRSAGSALILAWLLVLICQKRWRATVIFCVVVAVLTGPWFIWQALHPASPDFVGAYYTKLNYQHNTIFSTSGISAAPTVFGWNMLRTLVTTCPLGGLQFGLVGTLLSILTGFLCLAGLIYYIRDRKLLLAASWFVLSTGMVQCWMFSPPRYQVPLLGFSLILLTHGIQTLARRTFHGGRVAVLIVLAACSVMNMRDLYNLRRITIREGSPVWSFVPPDNWPRTLEAMAWLREHMPTDAVVAANCDPMVFLYAERKAIRLFNADNFLLFFDSSLNRRPLGSAETLKCHLKANRVSYILMTPMKYYAEGQFLRGQLAALMQASPAAFQLEKRFDDPGFYILKVDRSKL